MTDRLRAGIAGLTAFRELSERGLALLPADAPRRARLQAIHDLYAWLEHELPVLFERWERERKGQAR
jgi:hypothetical protein